MDIIKLYNRYRDKVYLKKVTENIYEFRYDDDENVDNFARFGYDDNPHIPCFVDPPGGPLVCVGENKLSVIDSEYKLVTFICESMIINPSNNHTVLTVSHLKLS